MKKKTHLHNSVLCWFSSYTNKTVPT